MISIPYCICRPDGSAPAKLSCRRTSTLTKHGRTSSRRRILLLHSRLKLCMLIGMLWEPKTRTRSSLVLLMELWWLAWCLSRVGQFNLRWSFDVDDVLDAIFATCKRGKGGYKGFPRSSSRMVSSNSRPSLNSTGVVVVAEVLLVGTNAKSDMTLVTRHEEMRQRLLWKASFPAAQSLSTLSRSVNSASHKPSMFTHTSSCSPNFAFFQRLSFKKEVHSAKNWKLCLFRGLFRKLQHSPVCQI